MLGIPKSLRNTFVCTVFLLAGGTARAAVLADSNADFSGTQGSKNWYYGYFPAGNINAFTQLPSYNAQVPRWQHPTCCPPFTFVNAGSGMHPNGTNSGTEEWATREWVSSFAGSVTVSGLLAKTDVNSASTGVFGRIYLNHQLLYEHFVAGTDGTGVNYSLNLTLQAGDILDFSVAPNGGDSNDATVFSATIASVYDTVQVDFATSTPVVKSALGFLHGFDGSFAGPNPVNSGITPLQPHYWRSAALLTEYQRIRTAMPNNMVDLILSDVYGYPGNQYNGRGVAPWQDWNNWESFVQTTIAPFKPLPANVEFEVWNEPDDAQYAPTTPGYQEFWSGTREQFYETYLHAFQVIRNQLGPNALVAGPSFTVYDHAAIQDFLEYCLANACEVNALTWHALNDFNAGTLSANVQDARSSFLQNPRYAPLKIMRIDVNEIVGALYARQPAGALTYYSALEASQADAAAKSCWPDSQGTNECFNGTLDGLFAASTFLPRSIWWAHKYYADGVATRVKSSVSTSNVVVLASTAGATQTPQVLVGYVDFTKTQNKQTGMSNVQLLLNNVNALPQFAQAQTVSIKVEAIPDSGEAALSAATQLGTLTVTVIQGTAQVNLPPLSVGEVFRLSLLPSTAAPATMSLSQNSLNFGVAGPLSSGPQSATLTFANATGIAWNASSNESNITVTPASGIGNASLQIAAAPGSSGVVTVSSGGVVNSPQQILVKVNTVTEGSPFGSFETPADNTTGVSGAVAITGWALDNVEVTGVDVWRERVGSEPVAGNGLVFIGNAVFVAGARPDVQTANPNAPFNYRAGWGYLMLTTSLPAQGGATAAGNGTYKIHAIAHNKAGTATDLGTKTITVDNAHSVKPFGTIDTPDQGATVSGSQFTNFGWALAQNPNCIPIDGSTLYVTVDGVTLGHPTYNQSRSDLAAGFPGRCNTNGAAGYFFIDTTTLSNGVHTIAWIAYDNHGNGDGLGSRFFNVLNSSSSSSAAPAEPFEEATVDAPKHVDAEELQRIKLKLGASSGYLWANGRQLPLPAGSTLQRGNFYWQLAPGFLGRYELVFRRADETEIRVPIEVHPKRYSRAAQ